MKNLKVLIITEPIDNSVDSVIDWIHSIGNLFLRNRYSELYEMTELEFDICDKKPIFHDFYSIWYRGIKETDFTNYKDVLGLSFANTFWHELKVCNQMLSSRLHNSFFKSLSSLNSFHLKKLVVLETAKKIGINTPHTKIINNRKDLKDFLAQYKNIICKSIGENLTLFFDNNTKALKQYVVEIDGKMLKDLPEKFFPTLFQQRIDKQMDLRIFYLEGKLFPMAIFSQCLDYREDYHNHRNVPIKLPEDLEKKLHQLMQKLDLNTGSIDMVRCAKTKKYYFLEVNPNGQFGMVSKPCNYYLEREIAEFLTT